MLDRKFLERLRRVTAYAAIIMYHLHHRQQAQQQQSSPEGSVTPSSQTTSTSGTAFQPLPYALKDIHTLYLHLTTLISTLDTITQKGSNCFIIIQGISLIYSSFRTDGSSWCIVQLSRSPSWNSSTSRYVSIFFFETWTLCLASASCFVSSSS